MLHNSIMKMEEAGLIDYWWRRYNAADPTSCLSENLIKQEDKKNKSDRRKRLTLKGLSGAFVFLIAGHILASLAFIIESSIARMKKHCSAVKVDPAQDTKTKQKDVGISISKQDDAVVTDVSINHEQEKDLKSSTRTEASDLIVAEKRRKVTDQIAITDGKKKQKSEYNHISGRINYCQISED